MWNRGWWDWYATIYITALYRIPIFLCWGNKEKQRQWKGVGGAMIVFVGLCAELRTFLFDNKWLKILIMLLSWRYAVLCRCRTRCNREKGIEKCVKNEGGNRIKFPCIKIFLFFIFLIYYKIFLFLIFLSSNKQYKIYENQLFYTLLMLMLCIYTHSPIPLSLIHNTSVGFFPLLFHIIQLCE